jgi:hypothetical protein
MNMDLYLGTHKSSWLDDEAHIPLCVSFRTMRVKKKLCRTKTRWVLDSGGFTELSQFGKWQTDAREYADGAMRLQEGVGAPTWACCQDWMCENSILSRTGLSIREHQERTTASFLELRVLAPKIRWLPVLQGTRIIDYVEHIEIYRRSGVDLGTLDRVGVGSVCRRQGTREVTDILAELSSCGLYLHAFGIKTKAFEVGVSHFVQSSDSMAWSYHARRRPPLKGCNHRSCANCRLYANDWHTKLQTKIRMWHDNISPMLY